MLLGAAGTGADEVFDSGVKFDGFFADGVRVPLPLGAPPWRTLDGGGATTQNVIEDRFTGSAAMHHSDVAHHAPSIFMVTPNVHLPEGVY